MALPLERPQSSQVIRQAAAIIGGRPWHLLGVLLGIGLALGLALYGYQVGARIVTLDVDGATRVLHTHQRLVGGVLEEAGLVLGPADELSLPLDAPWQPGRPIVVRRAYPVTVRADGRTVQFYGRPRSVLEILSRSGIPLQPKDKVYVNRLPIPEAAYADEAALPALLAPIGGAASPSAARALDVEIVRAVPVYVHDDGVETELRTTAATLGAALEEAGLPIYLADRIHPPLDTPASAGLHLYIERAMPVRVTADGRTLDTRTWAVTVGELLQQQGIVLGENDRVEPPLDTPLRPEMAVRVVRVAVVDFTVESPIPYTSRQEADLEMELDHYRLQPGADGVLAAITRVTYEDGREVGRQFLGEQVLRPPQDQVFYYGTKIVLRTLDTPYGTVEYWRKLRVWGTSYYPSTCGKSPDHPEYGITFTGKRATRGIIAVDPRVIPLHTRMYVPGYGLGAAEDTGGKIKGLHIDVCFDDADRGKGLWDTHYVDVYLLTPLPPLHKIPWILPGRLPGPGE